MNFLEFRAWFNNRLSLLLQQKTDDFILLSTSSDIVPIVSYIGTVAKEGKRFRPFLAYLGTGIQTSDECDAHFLLFASIELLHIFALVHDDIMDSADTRHGVVCAHKKFIEPYGDYTSRSIGILLGDILFAWAYECLFEYRKAFPHTQRRIDEEFNKLVREVMHGQLLDVLSPVQSSMDKDAIIEKMTLKTARYSFVQPLRLGFVVRGDSSEDQSFADTFGVPLGIGFQFQDDLLDGMPKDTTGKTPFVDIQTRQQTLLSWYMHHMSNPDEREKFMQFYGKNDINENSYPDLISLLDSSGAIAYVKKKSEEYFSDAEHAIHRERPHDGAVWQAVVNMVRHRNS